MLHVRSHSALVAALILVFVTPLVARAQAPTPVSWAVRVPEVSALKTGTEVTVLLTATVAPGWHIYSLTQKPGGPIPMSITVPAGEPFVLARAIKGPKPEIQSDATLDVPIELYSGTAEFPVALKLTVTGAGAVLEGRITTRYQVCSDTTCLPPRNITLPVRVELRTNDGAR